jgi:hypothetical protein
LQAPRRRARTSSLRIEKVMSHAFIKKVMKLALFEKGGGIHGDRGGLN